MMFLVCLEDRKERKQSLSVNGKNVSVKSIKEFIFREEETYLFPWEKMENDCENRVCRSWTG